ncbi:MAG: MFS transporter, partial [Bdellovibrionota bacterium]
MRKSESNVMVLGWISLFNDLGSEVLARLVPFFVTGVLGASMSAVGMIEGAADATATLLKPYFGGLSDRLKRRKPLVIAGYSLSTLARPFLALAASWQGVAVLRFLDRVGKGVRTAPRDALIADSGRAHGRNFGINRMMDTFGALIGVAAFAAWASSRGANQLDSRTWVAFVAVCSIPGFIATGLALFGIREVAAKTPASQKVSHAPIGSTFKRYLVVVAIFSLANSSDAFILLRAKELGYTLPGILGMIGLLNLVSSLTSVPAAALSDRLGRRTLIAMGWGIYALTYALFGSQLVATSRFAFAGGVAIYGLFFGFTESVERAWIADLAPAQAR